MMQEEELYRYQTEALAESIVKNKDNYCTKIQIKIHHDLDPKAYKFYQDSS